MNVNFQNANNDLNVNYGMNYNNSLVLVVSDKTGKYYLIDSYAKSHTVYPTSEDEIKLYGYDNFQEFDKAVDLRLVKDSDYPTPENLYTMFKNNSTVVNRLLYKFIDKKISTSPKFDQVAFLCGDLVNFYFKSNNNTIIKLSHKTSFIPREDSRNISNIKFINDEDNKVTWENAVQYETSGLLKNLTKEEIIIILQQDTEYVTKDEVKNILDL